MGRYQNDEPLSVIDCITKPEYLGSVPNWDLNFGNYPYNESK